MRKAVPGGRGIGADLLAAFEAWAARGAHLCELETHYDRSAQRLYARHGWQVAYMREGYYNYATWVLMTKLP